MTKRHFKQRKQVTRHNDNLSDCNWTRTENNLVRKRTLSHLANLTKG